jgi:AraC-like DNA-binding protein
MAYLTRWRMLLASDRLTHSTDPVSAIAAEFGYESESAFSTAFKRTMGIAPRKYAQVAARAPGQFKEASKATPKPL